MAKHDDMLFSLIALIDFYRVVQRKDGRLRTFGWEFESPPGNERTGELSSGTPPARPTLSLPTVNCKL